MFSEGCLSTSLCKRLTLYDPMALICDTMAVWTWWHGTPTSLTTKWENNTAVGHLSYSYGISSPAHGGRFRWFLTRLPCRRRGLGQLVCCLWWCTVPKRGRRPLRSSSKPSCSLFLFSCSSEWWFRGLYSTQGGNNKQFYDCLLVMWTCDKLISMTLSIKNNHSRAQQIQFSGVFIWNKKWMHLWRWQISDFDFGHFTLTVAHS